MPSTSDARRALIAKWFPDKGNSGPDFGCICTLESMGFTVDRGGLIHPPVSSHSLTWEQWEMVLYLVEEWDYGFNR